MVEQDLFVNKTAIIFDFDGTIADSLSIHEKAFQDALVNYKLQFEYKNYSGISTGDAIRKIFSDNNVYILENELGELVKTKRRLANQLYKGTIQFMPGAETFIISLFRKKFQLFVASSGSRMNITAGMQALKIEKYFKGIITADDVSNAKPDPAIFQAVLNKYSIPANQAIVIEDSIAGLLAAKAAGINAVCVDKTVQMKYPDDSFLIYDFFELSVILENNHGK